MNATGARYVRQSKKVIGSFDKTLLQSTIDE